MASDTKSTELKRHKKTKRQNRRRKNREARRSTRSWDELFASREPGGGERA